MALSPTQLRALVFGFADRAERVLRTPAGPIEPDPNRVSLILNELVQTGQGSITQTNNGPVLRIPDEQARAEFMRRITVALEEGSFRQNDRGADLFFDNRDSDFRLIVENSRAVFDPDTREIVALSEADLNATLERLGQLENATVLRDNNLSYMKPQVTRLGGVLRKIETNVIGRFPTVSATRQAAQALEEARKPHPKRINALEAAIKENPQLREHLMPGVRVTAEADEIRESLVSLDRYEMEVLESKARMFIGRQKNVTRDRDILSGSRQEAGYGREGRNVGVDEHLESMRGSRPNAVQTSVERQNRERSEDLQRMRRTRAFQDRPDLATATMLEEEQMVNRIDLEQKRDPEATAFRTRVDLVGRMERRDGHGHDLTKRLAELQKAARGLETELGETTSATTAKTLRDEIATLHEATNNVQRDLSTFSDRKTPPFVGSVAQVGDYNLLVINGIGQYDIIPFEKFAENCVGKRNHDQGQWSDGLPSAKVMRQWVSLDAEIHISPASGFGVQKQGLRIFGERPETLRERTKADAERRLEQLTDAELVEMQNSIIARDVALVLGEAQSVARNVYGFPTDPIVFGFDDLQESIEVPVPGHGTQLHPVTYEGPILAKGDYTVAQLHGNAIYAHPMMALGMYPSHGEVLAISYQPGFNKEYAKVERRGHDQAVKAFVQRFEERMSDEHYLEIVGEHAISAVERIAEMGAEQMPQIRFLDRDLDPSVKNLVVEGEVVLATPVVSFLYDEKQNVLVPLDHGRLGNEYARGDKVRVVATPVGVTVTNHRPAQSADIHDVQGKSIDELLVAQAQTRDGMALDALAQAMGVEREQLIPLTPAHVSPDRPLPHVLSTNHAAYVADRFADGSVGYLAVPSWDDKGRRTTQSWEVESVGWAHADVAKNGLTIEALLPSERDNLGLTMPHGVPTITILEARLPMQVVLDADTREIKERRPRDLAVPGRFADRTDATVSVDITGAAERNIRTFLLLSNDQVDMEWVPDLERGRVLSVVVNEGRTEIVPEPELDRELAMVTADRTQGSTSNSGELSR